MSRKDVLRRIDILQQDYCHTCQHVKADRSASYHAICGKCTIGKRIKALGDQLARPVIPYRWTKEESFYALNHIDVLGLISGVPKVSRKLALDEVDVETHYFRKKEKAHHTKAV
ncbi:zinc-finger domain-containing protein [Bacillus solitudinis]|uniref:zinc-finger domain-containing protein n=1 Tax=Bacillus solitudinis TaxID=2014074 RepID=UPI000C240ABC|nr:zinc-finger domain-containing protein [Bacillus solitudinis]